MKYNKLLMGFTLVAFFLLPACGNEGSSSKSLDNKDGNDDTHDTVAEIDYGLYCDDNCKEALSLKSPQDSIKGEVGFAVASTTFPYGAALTNQNEEAAKKYFPNIEFIIGDGQNDASIQTRLVDDYISRGVDVIVINAVQGDALVSAVERAKEAGIKVITVDRKVNTSVLTEIKANDIDLGENAGKFLIEALGGEGKVVELQGAPSASPTIDRNKGFMQAIGNEANIEVIASQNADYDQAKGLSVMEDILQRFSSGEIDAVFSHADNMTLGAIQAIKAAGREDEIVVVSIDGQQEAMEAIKAGEIDATVVYPVISPMAVIAAAKAIAGEEIPEEIILPAPIVTKNNVDQYLGTNF